MKNSLISIAVVLATLILTDVKAQWNDISFVTRGEVRGITDVSGKVKGMQEATYKASEKFGSIEKGDVLSVNEMKFNAQGKFVERWATLSDSTSYLCANYKYDSKGRCIESGEYGKDGKQMFGCIYTFDSNSGWTAEVTEYNDNGKFNHQWIYRFSPLGRFTEKLSYAETGDLAGEYAFKYNSVSKLIEVDEKVNGEVNSKIIFVYDTNDKLSTIKYGGNDDTYSEIQTYNGRGDMVKVEYARDGGGVSTFKYTYDKQGNWTEKVEYFQQNDSYLPTPKTTTVRAITY